MKKFSDPDPDPGKNIRIRNTGLKCFVYQVLLMAVTELTTGRYW
jgi:hypothetical protein